MHLFTRGVIVFSHEVSLSSHMWCHCHVRFTGSYQGPHEKKLLDELFTRRGHNKLERPVFNDSEALAVQFGLTLQQIIEVVRYLITIYITSFPCRYRQQQSRFCRHVGAGFTSYAYSLMKRLTAQHSGT